MNTRKTFLVLAVMLAAVCAFAEGTRTWEQTKFEEFEKGTAKGVAIRSDGTLELAPAFKPVTTTPSTYIWAIAPGRGGDVYVAAGAPARVYHVTPDGKSTVIFEPQELQVQSLVVDSSGVIYAATSPDGKIYKLEHHEAAKKGAKTVETLPSNGKVDTGWTSSVIYEPKTKYIWDLALDTEGNLYIATGDHGEIFRVSRSGEGALFFKSDEAHIRTLALDPKGNLIAGSDGSGLVYRIAPTGEAFVLYSAPKKEITALAVDGAGNIYAAGVGEKRGAAGGMIPNSGGGSGPGPSVPTMPQAIPTPPPGASTPMPLPPNFPLPGLGAAGSEVYQLAPDGSPRRIWSSRDDIVYALGFDAQGHLLAGTGNKGRIYLIYGDQRFTDLLKASATQVTAFAKSGNGGLYVSTSNLGKLFLLGGTPETEGTYQSDVFDARNFSRWGRAEVRGTGTYELWARSGNVDNPDRNWSPWKSVDLANGADLTVPPARFVQWKAVLRPGDPAPRVDSVLLNYLPKNVAPVIEDITVLVGARGANRGGNEQNAQGGRGDSQPAARDSIIIRWNAHDDNDDQLLYTIYYRGDGETKWKLLKSKVSDKSYSFDEGLLPDGGYTVKIVATDAPSHTPEEALSDERESARFEVDTTPPRIDDLNAAVDAGMLHVTFRATDAFSVVKRAEYSIDAGDWQFVEPVGQLSDARTENYDFAVPVPGTSVATGNGAGANAASSAKAKAKKRSTASEEDAPATPATGEHLVVVRVWDRFDNIATAKYVIHTR